MNGILILLLLILTAALPVIIAYVWFRARKPAISAPWFLASLAVGVIALVPAALIQNFLPSSGVLWPGQLLFGVFIRTALVEEASRYFTLIPLLETGNRRLKTDGTIFASLGFISGLGFAMVENAAYGIADINLTLIRAFTAAPLHAACGTRAGEAVYIFRQHPIKSFLLFISAVIIHGLYNLMILSPVLPSMLAIPIAYAALFASFYFLRINDKNEEST